MRRPTRPPCTGPGNRTRFCVRISSLVDEMELEQNVADVVGERRRRSCRRRASGRCAPSARPWLLFEAMTACSRLLMRERVVEEDLVLFILGQAGAIDVQGSHEDRRMQTRRSTSPGRKSYSTSERIPVPETCGVVGNCGLAARGALTVDHHSPNWVKLGTIVN